jgi:hypothetical protein
MRRAWSKPIHRKYPKPTCVFSDVGDNTCGQQLAANAHLIPVRESEEIYLGNRQQEVDGGKSCCATKRS